MLSAHVPRPTHPLPALHEGFRKAIVIFGVVRATHPRPTLETSVSCSPPTIRGFVHSSNRMHAYLTSQARSLKNSPSTIDEYRPSKGFANSQVFPPFVSLGLTAQIK